MSVLFGAPPRERRWGVIPPIPPNSAGSGGSYARVDLRRAEASLQKVAVWACVALIRSIVEMLPLDAYVDAGEAARPVEMPPWLENLSGEAGSNADAPGLSDWCSQVVYSAMLRGNATGIVGDRLSTGHPSLIALQHPDCVTANQLTSGVWEWRIEGKVVDRSRIWHRRVHSVPGQVMGLSPIAMHALTIGTGIAAMRFGSQFFEDGAHPTGLLTTPAPVGQTAARTVKQRFMDAVAGKREPVVMGGGWKFEAIQIAPNESQFLETHEYTGAECCRIYGPALAEVLGYKTGNSLDYKNIEQRSIDLLTYAADPWLVRLERMLTALIPGSTYMRFNRGALLRTDLLTRFQAHAIALQNRWKVVNEVRDDEDMTPVSWGNEPAPERTTGPAPAPMPGSTSGGQEG